MDRNYFRSVYKVLDFCFFIAVNTWILGEMGKGQRCKIVIFQFGDCMDRH